MGKCLSLFGDEFSVGLKEMQEEKVQEVLLLVIEMAL